MNNYKQSAKIKTYLSNAFFILCGVTFIGGNLYMIAIYNQSMYWLSGLALLWLLSMVLLFVSKYFAGSADRDYEKAGAVEQFNKSLREFEKGGGI